LLEIKHVNNKVKYKGIERFIVCLNIIDMDILNIALAES